VKRKKTGLTMMELLIVLGIIALLVGLLVPALSAVRKMAKETKQKAQLSTIELALAAFKNDEGDYPPSDWTPAPFTGDYCGSQKLAEALLGWDLLGFHPQSSWDALGTAYADPDLNKRKGPYLELGTTNAFRLGNISISKPGLFYNTAPLAPDTFVICDAFGTKKITLANGNSVKAGAPILYYKANTSQKIIRGIYDVRDNDAIVLVKQQADGKEHPLSRTDNQFQFFYGNPNDPQVMGYIQDPKITARDWPYRPDSYILISAGADGLYGTSDDIRNFGN
jgi:type II secretory pathway pseudopilin PulG